MQQTPGEAGRVEARAGKPMQLLWSERSPFVRKVMITLYETGQLGDVALQPEMVALHLPPGEDVLALSPLGKIPVLTTEGGQQIYDSRVICDYLDGRAGGGLMPSDPEARLDQLRWQALGDGILDILLLWRTELTREGGVWPELITGWRAKLRRAMGQLDAETAALGQGYFGPGQIAVICALGHLDFRWPDCGWRAAHPGLAQLCADWATRESVAATSPPAPPELPDPVTSGQLSFEG